MLDGLEADVPSMNGKGAMRGSVIKKGDRWYVKIELDPDQGTGKRRQKWHSGFNTKREAERARVDLLSKFDRGEYVEPTHQTVADFMVEWLKAIEPTVRPSTFESYERNMRNHVIAHIGAVRLTKVDAGRAQRPVRHAAGDRSPAVISAGEGLLARGRRSRSQVPGEGMTLQETADYLRVEFAEAEHITKDTLASLLRRTDDCADVRSADAGLDRRTVNYVHTILHRAFKDAVRWGRLARNPADAADPPKAGHKLDDMPTWDAETLRSFIEQSKAVSDRLHALWVLLATTGMRRGEALGLRWRDVDLDKGKLRVVQTVIQTRVMSA